MRDGLHDLNWTLGLWIMNSVEEMAEFVHRLWSFLRFLIRLFGGVQQMVNTAANLLTTFSCRACLCTLDAKAIWKAQSEGKHVFFPWLLVQTKVLTGEKLMARL